MTSVRREMGVAESDCDYDVALSLAGEDRDYVDQFAKLLDSTDNAFPLL